MAWGNWNEARRLAVQLRNAPGGELLKFDLDVRLATIQARQGDLSGGLASLEKWRGSDAKAPGMFEARLASVHSAAGDHQGYIALMERAAELSKNDPSRLIDVALAHARFGDAEKAQATMAQIDTSLLPPVAGSFIDWIFGLLHLRAMELDDATAHLRAAALGFRQLAYKSAAGWTSLALAAAHCAAAEAQQGRRDEARKSVDGLERIIAVHADPALLKTLHDQLPEQFPAT
jgi:tetratricopeptide (TPR) repeat protein